MNLLDYIKIIQLPRDALHIPGKVQDDLISGWKVLQSVSRGRAECFGVEDKMKLLCDFQELFKGQPMPSPQSPGSNKQ